MAFLKVAMLKLLFEFDVVRSGLLRKKLCQFKGS